MLSIQAYSGSVLGVSIGIVEFSRQSRVAEIPTDKTIFQHVSIFFSLGEPERHTVNSTRVRCHYYLTLRDLASPQREHKAYGGCYVLPDRTYPESVLRV